MENRRDQLRKMGICVGLLCIIMGTYFIISSLIEKNNMITKLENQEVKVLHDVLLGIEEVETRDGIINFFGWILKRGEKGIQVDILLQSLDGSKSRTLQTERGRRGDTKNRFGTDTEICGFKTEIREKKIDRESVYEIFLMLSYRDEEKNEDITEKIATNRYFHKGKLFRYNPKDFDVPKVSEGVILDIVQKGQLQAFDAEKSVWIYQVENKLFCIADIECTVSLEQAPSVPTGIYTFWDELIPEEKKNEYLKRGCEYIGPYLDEEHCVLGEGKRYYLECIELPEYPITYIWTGIYANTGDRWISRNEFQMEFTID